MRITIAVGSTLFKTGRKNRATTIAKGIPAKIPTYNRGGINFCVFIPVTQVSSAAPWRAARCY
jgi:hypothetical protein